jgi:hypothetical protein
LASWDVGRDRDPLRIGATGQRSRAGRGHHLGERLPVVPVLMGRHDLPECAVTDERQQRRRVVRRVHEQPFAGLPAGEQVRVVVHRPHRHLADRQRRELLDVGAAATPYRTGVAHSCLPDIRSGDRFRPQAHVTVRPGVRAATVGGRYVAPDDRQDAGRGFLRDMVAQAARAQEFDRRLRWSRLSRRLRADDEVAGHAAETAADDVIDLRGEPEGSAATAARTSAAPAVPRPRHRA